MYNTEEKEKDKPREKKVYLSDSKNDDIQQKSVEYMKKLVVKGTIQRYTGKQIDNIEYQLFYKYLESRTKPNKSPNSFNLRIERIYNAVISMYSDFLQDYGELLSSTKSLINRNNTSVEEHTGNNMTSFN